jgi:hypothetical protein
MSDREWAFGQLLATLGPLSELAVVDLQAAFNAGSDWEAGR